MQLVAGEFDCLDGSLDPFLCLGRNEKQILVARLLRLRVCRFRCQTSQLRSRQCLVRGYDLVCLQARMGTFTSLRERIRVSGNLSE